MGISRPIPIKIIGIGGAGGNTVDFMIKNGVSGVEFIVANTDASALERSSANVLVQIGHAGLGAGIHPDIGRRLAEESIGLISSALLGARLVIALAGLGKGTGSGATPVVIQTARRLGAVTIVLVTTPFSYEGKRCNRTAEMGLEAISKQVDSLFVLDNERFEVALENSSMMEWLQAADDALSAVAISAIDICSASNTTSSYSLEIEDFFGHHEILAAGSANATGTRRARDAVERALSLPLFKRLDNSATNLLLIGIEASPTLAEWETDMVIETVRKHTSSHIPVRLGIRYVDNMGDAVLVSVVALHKLTPRSFPSEWAARVA